MKEKEPEFLGGEKPIGTGDAAGKWGSDVIADTLHRLGIEYVVMNPGYSFACLHDSLVNYRGNKNPQILLALHEESAVSIAQGYAKVTERPMGAIVHSNVGLMHATMSIYNAWCNRVPVIILGATGPVDASRRRPWIDWIHTSRDQGALVRDYTKWDDQPASVPAAVESLLRASMISQTPPRGPVYVCLDVGMQEDRFEEKIGAPDMPRFMPAPAPQASSRTLDEAAKHLSEAERPLILMGRTSRRPEAWDCRVQLAEALGAKVLTDLKVGSVFPSKHPLHAGAASAILPPETIHVIRDADVILSLDWVDLGGTLKRVWGNEPAGARIIGCSVDVYNHNGWSMDYFGLPPVDLPIMTEPDILVPQLLECLKGPGISCKGGERFRADAAGGTGLSRSVDGRPRNESGPINYRDFGSCLKKAIGDREVCITNLPIGWPLDVLDFRGPLDFLGNDGGGGLGSGPGIAVGAALALRGSNRLTMAVIGDGDYLMGVTALWTAAHYRIPLLIIVANNRSYGNSMRHQERLAKERGRPVENSWIGTRVEDPLIDMAGTGRIQGMQGGGPITDLADLPGALEAAIQAVENGAGYVLDVVVES